MSASEGSAIRPQAVTGADLAFGGTETMRKLMPPMSEIPSEFQRGHTKWNELFSRWFFSGLPGDTDFVVKDGIDAKAALRHIATVMRSFEPKHEHKEACVAYLLSLWFDDVKVPESALSSIQERGRL